MAEKFYTRAELAQKIRDNHKYYAKNSDEQVLAAAFKQHPEYESWLAPTPIPPASASRFQKIKEALKNLQVGTETPAAAIEARRGGEAAAPKPLALGPIVAPIGYKEPKLNLEIPRAPELKVKPPAQGAEFTPAQLREIQPAKTEALPGSGVKSIINKLRAPTPPTLREASPLSRSVEPPSYPEMRARTLADDLRQQGTIRPEGRQDLNLAERAGRTAAGTAAQLTVGAGQAAQMAGLGYKRLAGQLGGNKALGLLGTFLEKSGKATAGAGRALAEKMAYEDPGNFEKVVGAFASGAAFFVPGLGIAKATEALAYAPQIATAFGVTSNALLESWLEAGMARQDALDRGLNEANADAVARKVFKANLPITALGNKLGIFAKTKTIPGKFAQAYLAEGVQEAGQEVAQNVAAGNVPLKGTGEAFALGGLVGGTMGAVESLARPGERRQGAAVAPRQEVAVAAVKPPAAPAATAAQVEGVKGPVIEAGKMNEILAKPEAKAAAAPSFKIGEQVITENGKKAIIEKVIPFGNDGYDVKIKYADGRTETIHESFVEKVPVPAAVGAAAPTPTAQAPKAEPGTFKHGGVTFQIIEPKEENFKGMDRSDMEDYITTRHAALAPQAELDKLTDIYSEKVPASELQLTEEDIQQSRDEQGDSPELDIIQLYLEYTNPKLAPARKVAMERAILEKYTEISPDIIEDNFTGLNKALRGAGDLYVEAQELAIAHRRLKDLTSLAKPEKGGKKAAETTTPEPAAPRATSADIRAGMEKRSAAITKDQAFEFAVQTFLTDAKGKSLPAFLGTNSGAGNYKIAASMGTYAKHDLKTAKPGDVVVRLADGRKFAFPGAEVYKAAQAAQPKYKEMRQLAEYPGFEEEAPPAVAPTGKAAVKTKAAAIRAEMEWQATTKKPVSKRQAKIEAEKVEAAKAAEEKRLDKITRDAPLKAVEFPAEMPAHDKIREMYKLLLKTSNPDDPRVGMGYKIWEEQTKESIENPERYGGPKREDINPKNLKIGDVVRVKDKQFGDYNAYVMAVNNNAPKAYAGGYEVQVARPGRYSAGWHGIDEMEKVGAKPAGQVAVKAKAAAIRAELEGKAPAASAAQKYFVGYPGEKKVPVNGLAEASKAGIKFIQEEEASGRMPVYLHASLWDASGKRIGLIGLNGQITGKGVPGKQEVLFNPEIENFTPEQINKKVVDMAKAPGMWEREGAIFELLSPGTQGNPGPMWEAGVRIRGGIAALKTFKTELAARAWLEKADVPTLKAEQEKRIAGYKAERAGKVTVLPQKDDVLVQVQAAIKAAPAKAAAGENPGVVEFKIDGGLKVKNTKEALQEAYDNIKKTPAEIITPGKISKPAISTGFARGDKFTDLIKVKQAGWISDGQQAIKMEAPKGAKYDEKRDFVADLFPLLHTKPGIPAKLRYYAINLPGSETKAAFAGVSDMPVHQDKPFTAWAVLQAADGKFFHVQQNRILNILNHYPEAEFSYNEGTGLIQARSGGEVVAVVKQGVEEVMEGKQKAIRPMRVPILFDDAVEAGLVKAGEYTPPAAKGGKGGGGGSMALNARHWDHTLPAEAVPGAGKVFKAQIQRFAEKAFNVPIMGKATIRMGDAVGRYYPRNGTIRMKTWGELEVMAHEIAHAIDDLISRASFRPPGRFGEIKRRNFSAAAMAELRNLDYDQRKRRTNEGFAEWFRHLMTTGKAEQLAPAFSQEFKGRIAGTQLEKDVAELGRMFKTWRDMGALERVKAQIDMAGETLPPETIVEKGMEKAREIYQAMVDKFNDLKIIEREAGIGGGGKLTPFEKATKFAGKSAAMAEHYVNQAAVDFDGNKIGMSLREALAPAMEITPVGFVRAERFRDFMAYAAAKRGLGRAKKGFETGFDVADMQYVVQRFAKEAPAWDLAIKQLDEWYKNLYSLTLGSVYTAEEIKAITDADLFYVSFKRAGKEALGGGRTGTTLTPGQPGYRYKGSGRPIINPFESAITDAHRVIEIGMKAAVAQSLAEHATAHPRAYGRVLVSVPAPQEAVTFTAEKLRQYLELEGIDVSELDLEKMVTIFKVAPKGKGNIVPIVVNGQRKFYEVEPRLYRALSEIGVPQLGLFNKLAKPFADLQRLGATGMNAAFSLLRNPLKDWQTFALFNTFTHNPLEIARALGAGTVEGVRLETGLFGKPSELTKRWAAAGGAQSGFYGNGRDGARTAYDEMLLASGKLGGKVLLVAKHPIDSMRRVFSIPEAGPRLAEFHGVYEKLAKEHPELPEAVRFTRAFNAAQDVTINFTRSGTVGRQMNHSIAFFNAAIQGPDKMARAAKENPYLFAIRGLTLLTVPALASWYKNKDKEWYKNLPYAYRFGNLFYETDQAVVRVPIPFDLGTVFMSAPAAVADYAYRKDPAAFKGLGEIVWGQVPSLMPSAFGPALDILRDKDFLNRPIEGPRLKEKNIEARVNPDTMKVAQSLAPALQALGIELSAVQVDYLLNDYSGGFFRRTGLTGGGIKEPADIPVLGSVLVRAPENPRRQIEKFFTERKQLQELQNSDSLTPKQKRRLEKMDRTYELGLKKKFDDIKKARAVGDRQKVDEKYKAIRLRLERFKIDADYGD